MKLLFIGLSPSKAFQNTVTSHGFSCLSIPKTGTEKLKDYDLLLIQVKNSDSITEIEKLRKRAPKAWIILVIAEKLLDQSDLQSQLIQLEAKNSVWPLENWENLFWLRLQEIIEHQHLALQVSNLQDEVKQLRNKSEEISKHSDDLLNQFKKDISLAENIQRALRPRHSPQIPGLSLSIKYIPASGLGGDYYDIFEFGDKKRFGILLADSKTHGMAATLLTVLLKIKMEEMKDRFPDSKSLMTYLNTEIRALHAKEIASLSLLYGILDRSTLNFQYTTAGPLSPFLWRNKKPCPLPLLNNPALGGMDHFDFREFTLALKPGDLMILHTDGLHEPLSQNGSTAFEEITKILKEKDPSPDPLEVQNEFMALVDKFISKKPLSDDLTLIHLAIDNRAIYVAR